MGNCVSGPSGGAPAAYAAPDPSQGACAPGRLARPHSGEMVLGVAAAGARELLSCADDGGVALWSWGNAGGCRVLERWAGHRKSATAVKYLRRAEAAVTASRDTTVKLWRRGAAEPLASLEGHAMAVNALAVSADERLAVSGSRDYQVKVWDLEASKAAASSKVSRNIVTAVEFLPSEPFLVAQGSEDLSVKVWDTRAMRSPAQTLRAEGVANIPLSLAACEDGAHIAAGSKGFDGVGCEMVWWDRRTASVECALRGHSMAVTATRCHGGAGGAPPCVTTASTDTTLRVWDVHKRECVASATMQTPGPKRPLCALAAIRAGEGLPDDSPHAHGVVVADVDGDMSIYGLDVVEGSLTELASSAQG